MVTMTAIASTEVYVTFPDGACTHVPFHSVPRQGDHVRGGDRVYQVACVHWDLYESKDARYVRPGIVLALAPPTPPLCRARTVLAINDEPCNAMCALPYGHGGDNHEDVTLGEWERSGD
jgi:hypothetical protein